jgi:hypothetical protein
MPEIVVRGTALYVRDINAERHKSPADFAARAKAMGLSWIALAAVWQDEENGRGRVQSKAMNSPAEIRAYADALASVGITPYVWGYPWLGAEETFIASMMRAAGDHKLILLDPELGANPSRATSGEGKARANAHARRIVEGLRGAGAQRVGLSTYGNVPPWFPLRAFLGAGLDFVGGQTYTDDARVDTSIAQFLAEMRATGQDIQLVPNFGLYSWGFKDGERKARSKTPEELRSHLFEFVDEGEPVHALIGWAENFVSPKLEPVLAQFARTMERGACSLPRI